QPEFSVTLCFPRNPRRRKRRGSADGHIQVAPRKTASIQDRYSPWAPWAEGRPYPMPQNFSCLAMRWEWNEPDLIPPLLLRLFVNSTSSRRLDLTGRANPATPVRRLPTLRVRSLLPRLLRRPQSPPTGQRLRTGSPAPLPGLRAPLAATSIESA